MKTKQNSTRWLGLALACVTLSFAVATQAGKPVKPPSARAYVTVVLGGLRSSEGTINTFPYDLNNAGQVVGRTSIPGYPSGTYSQPFLLNPLDTNADGRPDTWFVDAVNNATGATGPDGQNDLIVGLGNFPGAKHGQANAVNDLGLVVGSSHFYDPATQVSRTEAFMVVPSGANCWYQDLDSDGFNDFMMPLGRPPGVPDSDDVADLEISNLGQISGRFHGTDNNGVFHQTGFLLTPVEVAPGVWQWFQDDGSGANALMLELGNFVPSSINDSGHIIGTMDGRAMLWNPDGSLIGLEVAGIQSEGKAINNCGQVALSFHLSSDTFADWHAGFVTPLDTNNDGIPDIWHHDANGDAVNDLIVDLGVLKGLQNSFVVAHGLNDTGSVVGGSWQRTGRFWVKHVAFLWQNGMLKSLQDLAGGVMEFEDVSAINNSGQIVCETTSTPEALYANGTACILLPTR